MKKLYRYLLMFVMALCFSVPCLGAAEAAGIALVPLINNVQGDELANQIFYKNAIAAINAKKGFYMVENDKLTAAVEAAKIGSKVPTAAAMAKIAKDGGVDIVIALQLDELDDKVINSSAERKLQLVLKGRAVSYNRLTGKTYDHKLYGDKTIPEVLSSRWDWVHEEWGRTVRVEIDRMLRDK